MSNEARTVLITAPFQESWLGGLRSLSPELQVELWTGSARAIPDELWREVEILYMSFATVLPPPAAVPRLRWVQLYSAGADRIVQEPLFATHVMFTTSSGIHAINMAEYILTVVLAWFHRFPRM